MNTYNSKDPIEGLGAILRQARTERGLSQAKAYKFTHINKSSLSRLEQMKHSPRLSFLKKLLDGLGYEFEITIRKKP